jgi:hypothetical protein
MLEDEEPQLNRFDYATFDPDTRRVLRERAEQIRGLARTAISGIMEIGKHLTEVKEQLGHGQFLKWIDAEFRWRQRTAENYMAVYARFKSANFADLQIDPSALYLIAAPSTPESVRVEAVRRAESGEHVSHRDVRALVQRVKETGELAEVAVTPPGKIVELRRKTLRPRNKRQQARDLRECGRLMDRVSFLEGAVLGFPMLVNLEAVARAGSFDWASAIRRIHKSIKELAGFEKAMRRLASLTTPPGRRPRAKARERRL